jgi:hypothetical protein
MLEEGWEVLYRGELRLRVFLVLLKDGDGMWWKWCDDGLLRGVEGDPNLGYRAIC